MKMKIFLTAIVCSIVSQGFAGDIYVGNCDATNADVKSRRSCYTCCNDQNGNSVDTANCQESCDSAWTRVAGDFFPKQFLNALMASRGDWKMQMSFLDDEQLWDWFIADDEINFRVIEMVDWLYQNAADVNVERMAIVTLSWLKSEHGLTPDGSDLVDVILMDALSSEDYRVRRSALISMQETKSFLTNPYILVEMIRVTSKDPSQVVRDTGFQILADR